MHWICRFVLGNHPFESFFCGLCVPCSNFASDMWWNKFMLDLSISWSWSAIKSFKMVWYETIGRISHLQAQVMLSEIYPGGSPKIGSTYWDQIHEVGIISVTRRVLKRSLELLEQVIGWDFHYELLLLSLEASNYRKSLFDVLWTECFLCYMSQRYYFYLFVLSLHQQRSNA